MRVGIADHFGWAVAVTADGRHQVVDRRRIDLIEQDVTPAPIHYESKNLGVAATAALVEQVRASVVRASTAAFDELEETLQQPIVSIALRHWPDDFPTDIAVQMSPPYEARADAIMYRQVLAELADRRGWDVHLYDAKDVIAQAAELVAEPIEGFLRAPRAALGPPWRKDHRVALAAAIVS